MGKLISTEQLAGDIDAADLVVLDATAHLPNANRDAASEFTEGHIPGARFLGLESLKDTASPVPNAIPARGQLTQRLRSLGISDGQRIILYDDSAVKSAACAWFMLQHYGLTTAAILDGGIAKWKAEGRALETGQMTSDKGDITLDDPSTRVRTKADMIANIASRAEQVLDARDAGRFSGETEDTIHNLPTGHIPGSRNLPFGLLFASDGTYLPPSELERAFAGSGIDLDQPITTSCGSGVTASVLLFALDLIGKPGGALYDGSWSEWGADPGAPKASGMGG